MSFTEAVTSVFTNYANFNGRARRSEYWYFTLFNIIVSSIISVVSTNIGLPILATIWSLAVLIPGLAVVVRRLHDIGKSGWWYFIVLVPCVGAIMMIVFFCTDSEQGSNQYGDCPK